MKIFYWFLKYLMYGISKFQPKITFNLIYKAIDLLESKNLYNSKSKPFFKIYYFLNRLVGNYKYFNPDSLLAESIFKKINSVKDITYFDIGSGEGLYFDLLCRNNINIHNTYLFDLDEINYKILMYKYKAKKNVKIVNIGFSQKSQKVKIYSRFPGSQEYEIHNSKNPPASSFEQMVNFKTLNEYYFKNFSGKKIDYLNINNKEDSLEILLSGKSVLENFRIITFSINQILSYEEKKLDKYIKLLESNNFELFKFSELGFLKINSQNKLEAKKNEFYYKFVAIKKV